MSERTARIGLPYILPSQSQKHVTHNAALQRLDVLMQLAIDDQRPDPPLTPAPGECFIVTAPATGSWQGREGMLAAFIDGAWLFIAPCAGLLAYDLSSGRHRLYDGSAWIDPPLPERGTLASLGIATTADDTNRLSVSAQASLFTHAGGDHRLVVNRATSDDTASILFQTDWQGHAEMGLAGDGGFAIKVSPDGSAWTTALTVSPDGMVGLPQRPAVRASLAAGPLPPVADAITGFDSLPVANGGFTLGAALPSGFGARLVVPKDGLYAIGLSLTTLSSAGHSLTLLRNGTVALAALSAPASTARDHRGLSTLAELHAGDWLSLQHGGDAVIDFSPGATEVCLTCL